MVILTPNYRSGGMRVKRRLSTEMEKEFAKSDHLQNCAPPRGKNYPFADTDGEPTLVEALELLQ